MGKVKLAKKEDSTEQVSRFNLANILQFFLILNMLQSWVCILILPSTCRSLARSYPEAQAMMGTTVEQIRNGPTNLRKFEPPERLPLLPSSITPTYVVFAMSSEPITIGTCCSNT